MLPDKVQKRVASSVFITLVPPKRDVYTKTEARPQKAPFPHYNKSQKEVVTPIQLIPSQTSDGDVLRSKALHSPRGSGLPSQGRSFLLPPPPPPPPPLLPNNPNDADLDQLSPPVPPPALHSNPFPAEILCPELHKPTEGLATAMQTSTFPAEMRQSKILPLTPNGTDEEQNIRKVENTVSTDICAFCHKAISPRAPTLEAMNKQYHADCFTCRTCQQALAGQRYYQKDGRPLCVACYQNTLEKCTTCKVLILTQIVRAMGQPYHPECFTCVVCARPIGDETFALGDNNQVYCLDDFYRMFASVCGTCEKPIVPREGRDSYKIECMGRNFHEDCYRCERCHILLSPEPMEDGCYPLGSCLLCKSCHIQQTKRSPL